jgi:MazG family protein
MKNEYSSSVAAVFGELFNVIRTLRSENGCPWDLKQTPESFHPYILEEYHEMVQALNRGDERGMVDEAGDLTFLVVLVAYMFEQQGFTTVEEIIRTAISKMVRRHPHVFGETQVKDDQEVIDNWNKIKASEKTVLERTSHLDGIPRTLPALSRSQRLTKRAGTVGFDWSDPKDVFPKVYEELEELKQSIELGSPDKILEEFGDLFFVMVNAARLFNVNAEAALNKTTDKFESRFRYIEAALRERGKSLEDADLTEMDALWDEAKALERES